MVRVNYSNRLTTISGLVIIPDVVTQIFVWGLELLV